MARINIPLDAITSKLNLSGRFDSVRSQSIANRFANLKPISEFFDLKRLSKPRDFSDVQARINYNLSYFSSNYAVVFVMLSIYSLLSNLLLLFVIIFVVGGMYGIGRLEGRDLDLGFTRATSSQLYTGLLIVAVPLGLWASPLATALWLIGATGVSILGHATFMEKDVAASFSEEAEIDSADNDDDDDDDDYDFGDGDDHDHHPGHSGVLLHPENYAVRDFHGRASAGDELYYDTYDPRRDRMPRRPALYDGEYESDDIGYRGQGRLTSYQSTVREKEEALIQTALERIARARAKGKTNVSLSQEEMAALEHSGGQPSQLELEPESPRVQPPLASPPPTPAKAAKPKVGSRSNSSSSLASQKTRKRGGSGIFGGSSSSPAKSNSKAKVSRKPSAEQALPYPAGQAPAGIMVPGPNGVPVYAPIGYYGSPSPEHVRRSSSRSNSNNRRRESTPPERNAELYAPYPLRYHPTTAGVRPPSSGSNRSLPDDIDWHPPAPRHRSASSVPYPSAVSTEHHEASGNSSLPAAQGGTGRRNVSGPQDVRYSSLRRVPPSSSPLANSGGQPRQSSNHSDSQAPKIPSRGGARRSAGSIGSSSSGSDDQGVQVDIVPDASSGAGYSISRAPIPPVMARSSTQVPVSQRTGAQALGTMAVQQPSSSGNEGRRRKSGRR